MKTMTAEKEVRMMHAFVALAGLSAMLVLAHPLPAQCRVGLSATGPDSSGIVTMHVDAAVTTSCPNAVLSQLTIAIDTPDNTLSAPGTANCNGGPTCSYDQLINTYCWAPGVQHTFITSCSASCGGAPPPNPNAGGFTTGGVTKPALSASYDSGYLTYTVGFVAPPPQFSTNHQAIYVFINGNLDYGGPVDSTTGTTTTFIGNGTCGGDRTISVYATACNAQPSNTIWSTERDVTAPDPGQPTVSISVVPRSGDPTQFDAIVSYHFPSTGRRNLVVRLLT